MELYYQKEIESGVNWLNEEESRHAVKVLRRKAGDLIQLTDGKGNLIEAVITSANPYKCEFKIQSTKITAAKSYAIHIAIAPTKNSERMEWFVEKATEIGVDIVTLLLTKHSERRNIKTERLIKKTVSAMKQSGQCYLPQIHIQENFNSFIETTAADEKFIAHVDHENPIQLQSIVSPNRSYLILIGPEGDFSKEELESARNNGFIKVSMGKTRLRTETAGFAACHIFNLVNH